MPPHASAKKLFCNKSFFFCDVFPLGIFSICRFSFYFLFKVKGNTPKLRKSNFRVIITTHHVCAVGKVLCVGAAMIWKEGQRVLNPPGGS